MCPQKRLQHPRGTHISLLLHGRAEGFAGRCFSAQCCGNCRGLRGCQMIALGPRCFLLFWGAVLGIYRSCFEALCRHQGHPPLTVEDRIAAREIVPAGALIFTDARTFTSQQQHVEQLLEKLSTAQHACAFKHVRWQVTSQGTLIHISRMLHELHAHTQHHALVPMSAESWMHLAFELL